MNRLTDISRAFPARCPPRWHRATTRAALVAAIVLSALTFVGNACAAPHPAVARIIANEANGVSYGSGTLIDASGQHGLVITNWHVVRDATDKVTVVFPDGFRSNARVVKVDDNWDLAVLVIWRPPTEPVKLAARSPRPGDLLTIAGYGSGNYRAVSGRCTQYVAPGVDLPYEMVEVSVEARNGDSGGPIFNDRGELAGVLFGASRGATSGSYVGRVRWFIASVAPDLNRYDRAVVAVKPPSPPSTSRPVDVARLPSLSNDRDRIASRLSAPDGLSPLPRIIGLADSSIDSTAEPSRDEAETSQGLTWRSVAGETWYQQAKTLLAVIGIFAVMLQLTRLTVAD